MIREIIVRLKVCDWRFAARVMTFRRSFFAVSCPFLGGAGGDYRLALKKWRGAYSNPLSGSSSDSDLFSAVFAEVSLL
jgi:hypothetical protein